MRLAIVVPCYNEERRLPVAAFQSWLATAPADSSLLFVDDGSSDGTRELLEKLAKGAPRGRCRVLALGVNCGKAEAVRRGLNDALSNECALSADSLIGFWDSDLATPLSAINQLASVLHAQPRLQMVFAARVALLGRKIARNPVRHYLGRVFATLASLSLDLAIYDTQCGAKLFRVTPTLRAILAPPFLTGWVFDCEIIARFAALAAQGKAPEICERPPAIARSASPAASATILKDAIYEYPLEEWVDVQGSKVKPTDILRMALGLVRIRFVYFLREWPSGRPTARLPLVLGTVLAAGLLGLAVLSMLIEAATSPR